jgi:hypothetical protein
VQWSALWYRDGELVHYETATWAGGTGGYGLVRWEPGEEFWLPGEYQVQMFVGLEWKVVGRFIVEGEPNTATPTLTPTLTLTPTNTRTPTFTPTPSLTRRPSNTPAPSSTRVPTRTPLPTDTRWPTSTPSP